MSPSPPPPGFMPRLRLPPHRLQLDDDEFLRLLAGCVSLLKVEKRQIIQAVPRMSQHQVDELLEIMREELGDVRRSSWQWQQQWERIRERQARWWQELERELGH